MSWQLTPILFPLITAVILAFLLLIYARRQHTSPVTNTFTLMMVGILIWLLTAIFESTAALPSTKLFWINVQYLGIATVPVAGFMFALAYTGYSEWLTRRNILLLFAEPALIMVLIWTNPWHNLFRQSFRVDFSGTFPVIDTVLGPAFWLHTAYSYGLIIGGVWILARAFVQAHRHYKRPIGILLIGILGPVLANVGYIIFLAINELGWLPFDPTPFGFLFTGIMFAWGAFGFRLIDITPIARTQVIEKMRDGIIVLDIQNRVVDINLAAQEIINWQGEQIIGIAAADLFAPWPDLTAKYADTLSVSTDILVGQEDAGRHYHLNISPLNDDRGRLSGRIIMLHDMTEQKQAERALRQSKEAAEAANRAKSTFLATMSHELRTPLAAIIGYSELIHSVAELINHLHSSNQTQIEEKRNRLTLQVDSDLGLMCTDETRVRQILMNLLDNANKFTQEGEITFTAQRLTDEMQEMIRFQISDTGPGIPPEKMAIIFEPFEQADASKTRQHEGSGLGLALSHRLCQMMGGDIQVESEVGKGTAVTVTLPVDGAHETISPIIREPA